MTVISTLYPKEEKIKRLRLALILTATGMVLEFLGGIISRSLSLISDAGHMFTHLFALATSYFAIILSLQPVTKRRTYGLYRAEVLAAFINGIILIFVSFYLISQSISRFINPREIKIMEMLFISGIGLTINGITTGLLAKVSSGDINIRSAFLHELGDMLSSIAVVITGIIIFFTKRYIFDPLLSFFICALILIWSIRLIWDSTVILLESVPKDLDIDLVAKTIKEEIPGIYEVHHIHAWTIASSIYALTCHVVVEDCQISKANEILGKINNLVREKFHIGHTNIQFECLLKKEA
ncbi:MAG: cation diffusion facilitator family transporter [Candidatus Omnitrophica bacterium]|nr:cation diffusion facilitator family transporter [Candidatus Omnitrophota bacterium]